MHTNNQMEREMDRSRRWRTDCLPSMQESFWEWAVEGATALAVLGCAAALFSNSFILAEGRMLAFLLVCNLAQHALHMIS